MTNPIHISGTSENNAVTPVDVRIYYPAEMPEKVIKSDIAIMLGESERLVSAWLLLSDGFGHQVPDEHPIA